MITTEELDNIASSTNSTDTKFTITRKQAREEILRLAKIGWKAEPEIRRLRAALQHIAGDKAQCDGCISPDISLSEHYSYIAREALEGK